MKKTPFFFFRKYVKSYNKQLLSLLLGGILIFIKTVSKLQQQSSATSINNPKDQSDEKNFLPLFYFIWVSVIYVLSVPSLDLVASSFETQLVKNVFTSSYAEFTRYKLNNWEKHLKGDLYSVIIRRAHATGRFFKHLFFDTIDTFAYIVFGVFSLILQYGFVKHFKYGICVLISLPVVSNALSTVRNLIQRKSNEAYDEGEKKLKDIFLNYQLIHSYNTLDMEMSNYRREMVNAKIWFYMYWLANDIIEVINKLCKMLLIVVVFVNIDAKVYDTKAIFKHMTVFQSISKRLNSFIENAKKVVEASENVLHSKLDDLSANAPSHSTSNLFKDSLERSIAIVDLSKHYGSNLVFKNLNFTIQKGDKVAITGVNGSGKSSFIKSVVGIESFEGQILIDGVDSKDLRESSYSYLLSYVPQDPVVFSSTLYENITSFNSKLDPTDIYAKVKEFGMEAAFKEIGYDTVLSEGGSKLSSAQRQKISFMRAAIRDSPIVLFDEVTSEMDKEYESLLVDAIMSKMKNKTVIMVIHNLDLLPRFNKVVFFNNGTASECLPLDELLEEKEFKSYVTGYKNE